MQELIRITYLVQSVSLPEKLSARLKTQNPKQPLQPKFPKNPRPITCPMMTRTKITDSIYICKEVINIRLRANIFANYPDAMSLTDLAGALGISTKLASRLVRSGEIFGVKVGREYRVAKTSVMEYIEDARVAYPKRRKK